MYKLIFQLFYLHFLFSFLFSEDIFIVHGVVFDELTKKPIENVNVYSQENNIGTHTNSNGEFDLYIKNISNIDLLISHIAYENHILQLNTNTNDKILRIFIKPIFLDSDMIVITGNTSSKYLEDTSMITEVIDSNELRTIGASNVFESLQMILPNFSIQPDPHGANIKISGFDTEYIVILVDGERLSGNTYGNVDLNRLNVNDIDRIEIVKGSTAVLYGSNAIGSVINIITKQYGDRLDVKIGHRYSNYNTQNSWSSLKLNFKNFHTITDIVRKSSDGYDLSPNSPSTMDLRKFDDKSATQKIRYRFSNENILDFKYNYYEFQFFQALAGISENLYHRKRYKANNYTLNWKNIFFGLHQVSLSLNYDQYRKYHIIDRDYSSSSDDDIYPWTVDEYTSIKIIDVFSKGIQTFSLGYEFTQDRGKSHDVIIYNRPEWIVNDNGNGTWDDAEEWEDLDGDGHWDNGSEYYSDIPGYEDLCIGDTIIGDGDGNCETEPEDLEDINGNGIWDDAEQFEDCNEDGTICAGDPYWEDSMGNGIWNYYDFPELSSEFGTEDYISFYTHNLFFQDEIKINKNKIISIGFRYINHSTFNNSFTPSISFLFKKHPIIYRLNYSKGYRTPSLKELYYNWSHYTSFNIFGNSKLLPETSDYFSFAIEKLDEMKYFSTNFFINKINNLINEEFHLVDDGINYYDYQQYGSVISAGIDLNLKYKFLVNNSLEPMPIKVKFDFSYNYIDVYDLHNKDYINGNSRHSFNSRISRDLDKLGISLNLFYRYIGKKKLDIMVMDYSETGEVEISVPAYGLWKFSISSKKILNKINFSLGIDNMFNYISKEDPTNINPGRTFYISIEIG